MRAWRVALAATTLAGTAVAMPARADLVTNHALTVTGTRTAYATLRVEEPISFDYGDAVVVRRGAYGGIAFSHGFVLSTDDVPLTVGESGRPLTFLRTWTLDPGTYRVYLVSDGSPVTVRLPWSGPNVRLEATTPVSHEFRIQHRNATSGSWDVAIPFGAGPESLVYSTALFESRDPRYREVKVGTCISRSAASCTKSRIGLFAHADAMAVGALSAGAGTVLPTTRGWYAHGDVRAGASALGTLSVYTLRIGYGRGAAIDYDDIARWSARY